MSSIVVRDGSGKVVVLASSTFEYEEVLQGKIAELPKLVPMESIGADVEHITIGHEWPAGSGSADVVLLGSDAVLTIVETKLKRNPEARREVIAQILEYAAYTSELTISDISLRCAEFLSTDLCAPEYRGKTFDEALNLFLAEKQLGVESFKAKMEQNLRQGRLRLIVAVDELGDQAQKIVTFVNTFSSFDIYLLQIRSYSDGAREIFVPTLHGYARKAPAAPPKIQWSWEKYENEPGWTSDTIHRAKLLVSKLLSALPDGNAEEGFYESWVDVCCFGHKGVFGVEVKKKTGLNLYFWLDNFTGSLPDGVEIRQTKRYLYLYGNLEAISDLELRDLCQSALRNDGWSEAS